MDERRAGAGLGPLSAHLARITAGHDREITCSACGWAARLVGAMEADAGE